MAKRTFSKKAEKILEDFSDAAQDYGWEQDQGSYTSTEESLKRYNAEKKKIEKFILSLENKIRKLEASKCTS